MQEGRDREKADEQRERRNKRVEEQGRIKEKERKMLEDLLSDKHKDDPIVRSSHKRLRESLSRSPSVSPTKPVSEQKNKRRLSPRAGTRSRSGSPVKPSSSKSPTDTRTPQARKKARNSDPSRTAEPLQDATAEGGGVQEA